MPETRRLLAGGGVKFTNAFVTRSLCCPSRATIQRGQYTHNHQILSNRPPLGGFDKFRSQGLENSTIATWLDDAGYDTMLVGKYFNDYDNTTYVPPGWDNWYGYLGYYVQSDTYRISENGQINTYDRSQIHDTDLFADRAATFLESTAGGAPFFMYLSTNAPHTPAFAPQRHQSMFSDVSLPAPPSLNEADVSDKPAWMRNTPSLTSEELGKLRQRYRQRLRSLQSVDEMVGRLVGILRETGELSNTYIVFTSDNGLHLGEHRINTKEMDCLRGIDPCTPPDTRSRCAPRCESFSDGAKQRSGTHLRLLGRCSRRQISWTVGRSSRSCLRARHPLGEAPSWSSTGWMKTETLTRPPYPTTRR